MLKSSTMAATLLLASVAVADSSGRVCLGSAPTPTTGKRTLANPTGGLSDVSYSVRIDNLPKVELTRNSASWVAGLNLDRQHTVTIFEGGRPVHSFHFRFAEAELCLFLAPLYETWQLWPLHQLPDRCGCPPMSSKPLQPTRAAQPIGQREPTRRGPRG